VQAEEIQASIINGFPIDNDMLVRVSSALTKTLQALGVKRLRQGQHVTAPLRDRLLRDSHPLHGNNKIFQP
jgi:hypothetical protein